MNGRRSSTGHRVGEWHQNAKLTDAQVVEMRRIHALHGYSYSILGEMFGCGDSTARDIVKYRTRKDAGGGPAFEVCLAWGAPRPREEMAA